MPFCHNFKSFVSKVVSTINNRATKKEEASKTTTRRKEKKEKSKGKVYQE
jgi:hypothetical protein